MSPQEKSAGTGEPLFKGKPFAFTGDTQSVYPGAEQVREWIDAEAGKRRACRIGLAPLRIGVPW